MIPPKDPWVRFNNSEEKLKYMIDNGLASTSSVYPKSLIYTGGYTEEPVECSLVGYASERVSVIDVKGQLHCIRTDYLLEMQAGYSSSLAPECYVVLDVETTGLNHNVDSIIEVAAVKYRNGIETDSYTSFVNPPGLLSPFITVLTGISDEDLKNAPNISDVVPALSEFLSDYPMVAHNAPFDKSFISDAYSDVGLEFNNKTIDTLKLAQKAFPGLPSYKLEYLKQELSLGSHPSHRALSDVYTTAALYNACNAQLRKMQTEKENNINTKPTEGVSSSVSESIKPSKKSSAFYLKGPKPSEIQATVSEIDITSPLYEKCIVFTGTLSMTREEAMQIAVNCGAQLKTSVTSKTDYLVVGWQDPDVVGEDGMSNKEEKAHALNEAGKASIQIISESQFMELVNSEVHT